MICLALVRLAEISDGVASTCASAIRKRALDARIASRLPALRFDFLTAAMPYINLSLADQFCLSNEELPLRGQISAVGGWRVPSLKDPNRSLGFCGLRDLRFRNRSKDKSSQSMVLKYTN
jgi:hypothetical protein